MIINEDIRVIRMANTIIFFELVEKAPVGARQRRNTNGEFLQFSSDESNLRSNSNGSCQCRWIATHLLGVFETER